MNVSTEKLTAWNRFAELARQTSISARLAFAKGEAQRGRVMLSELAEAAAAASVSMEAAGAALPSGAPQGLQVPLELLNTPASRKYARLMREAYEAAREVDHERGYGDDGPADVLEGFAEAAEMDVCGPAGLLRE